MPVRKRLAFISYRRKDSSAASRWLAETIQAAFGSSSVFIDTDAIRIGEDWSKRIENALQRASVLVAVIGPSWLRTADDYGRRRLDNEDDWVRCEIVHAIEKKLVLIPLLVSGASLPVKEALPKRLVPMLKHQGVQLRDDQWEAGRNLLLERLEETGFVRKRLAKLPSVSSAELDRREALLFDQQIGILKTSLTLVYRARNAARSLSESPIAAQRFWWRE